MDNILNELKIYINKYSTKNENEIDSDDFYKILELMTLSLDAIKKLKVNLGTSNLKIVSLENDLNRMIVEQDKLLEDNESFLNDIYLLNELVFKLENKLHNYEEDDVLAIKQMEKYFDFGEAIRLLKEGSMLARRNYDGECVRMAVPSNSNKMDSLFIYMQDKYNNKFPWIPSYEDMLAEDWYNLCKED